MAVWAAVSQTLDFARVRAWVPWSAGDRDASLVRAGTVQVVAVAAVLEDPTFRPQPLDDLIDVLVRMLISGSVGLALAQRRTSRSAGPMLHGIIQTRSGYD